MSVLERLAAIRLVEQAKDNKKFFNEIGVKATMKERKNDMGRRHNQVEDDDEDEDDSEALSVWDAADIWVSNGEDEDYMFGYTESQLRRALKQ